MIIATKDWLRRNRTSLALGLGAIGTSYLAAQHVTSRLAEARERVFSDRVSKERSVLHGVQSHSIC